MGSVEVRQGVEQLTPARALVAELIRRYLVLGFECTMLEIQKLAYLLERRIEALRIDNPLKLEFQADRYGPYSPKLGHLLNGLDGSYLHSAKRVADAGPLDVIWFEDAKRDKVALLSNLGSQAICPGARSHGGPYRRVRIAAGHGAAGHGRLASSAWNGA